MLNDIEDILSGNYIEESRSLLSCNVVENDIIISSNLAFNDVVMHRKQDEKIIEFETYMIISLLIAKELMDLLSILQQVQLLTHYLVVDL